MPTTSSSEETLLRRAKWIYISALLMIAALNIASHFVMDSVMRREASTARVINLSGRQRMLSQRIVKIALQRAVHHVPHGDPEAQTIMRDAVDRMAIIHQVLSKGSPAFQVTAPSAAVREVYVGSKWNLNAQVERFLSNARQLADKPPDQLSVDAPDLLQMEEEARTPLLDALDAAVTVSQQSSERNINHMRVLLAIFTTVLLLLLLAEATLLFRPLFRRITRQQQRLLSIGRTDLLTGCFNRRAFEELAPAAIDRSRRAAEPLALLSLDLDHFKAVNDTYGHAAGDLVLKALASTLKQHMRSSDLLCRTGGEEFVLLLPHAHLSDLPLVADRFRLAVQNASVDVGTTQIHITVSVGAATLRDLNDTLVQLMARADVALYKAKHAGRNRVEYDCDPDVPADLDILTHSGQIAYTSAVA